LHDVVGLEGAAEDAVRDAEDPRPPVDEVGCSLFEYGWPTVLICGNTLFDPTATAVLRSALAPTAEVYHVTLAPKVSTVLSRCTTLPRDPARLAADAELQAGRPHPGTVRLDSTHLTPEATLAELVRLVNAGAGRLPS